MKQYRQFSGYSLLECLIIMALLALVLTLALPHYRAFNLHYRARMASLQFYRAVNQARGLAITRDQTVSICPAEDARGCVAQAANGYLIYQGHKSIQFQRISGLKSIRWRGFPAGRYLSFTPIGYAKQNGRFELGFNGVSKPVSLLVSQSGRIRLKAA